MSEEMAKKMLDHFDGHLRVQMAATPDITPMSCEPVTVFVLPPTPKLCKCSRLEFAPCFSSPCAKKIIAELNSIPAEMEKLDQEIGRAELLAAERLIERLRAEAKVGDCVKIILRPLLFSEFHCVA